MYDILQLNDMLVPELLDLAEHLDITDASRLNKQELIYKILDKQALAPGTSGTNGTEKPKRKRTVKASTGNTTEEAEVMTEGVKKEKLPKEVKPVLKDKNIKEEKIKRARPKLKTADAEDDNTEDNATANIDENAFPDVDESLT